MAVAILLLHIQSSSQAPVIKEISPAASWNSGNQRKLLQDLGDDEPSETNPDGCEDGETVGCDGVCGSNLVYGCDGTCDSGLVPGCDGVCDSNVVVGCDGICGSGLVVGCDGVCGSNLVLGCDGICGSILLPGCDGVCGSNLVFGCDGICGSGLVFGCDGECGSNLVFGCDGICGSGLVIGGCDNQCGSTAVPGCDGICGSGLVVSGCDQQCGSTKTIDCRGICGGLHGVLGCDGVCNSGAVHGCDNVCGSGLKLGCDNKCNSRKKIGGCDNRCGSTATVGCDGCRSRNRCGSGSGDPHYVLVNGVAPTCWQMGRQTFAESCLTGTWCWSVIVNHVPYSGNPAAAVIGEVLLQVTGPSGRTTVYMGPSGWQSRTYNPGQVDEVVVSGSSVSVAGMRLKSLQVTKAYAGSQVYFDIYIVGVMSGGIVVNGCNPAAYYNRRLLQSPPSSGPVTQVPRLGKLFNYVYLSLRLCV